MRCLTAFAFALLLTLALSAQETPYFVTYDHGMEEPGNLEISTQSTIGVQKHALPTYLAPLLEFEYGLKDWWTSSIYFESASQRRDSTVFTGYRIENRFKPLKGERKINPILYFEFENINEASRVTKEVLGHAEAAGESLSELRGEKAREIEAKLILSSNIRSWNVSENFIMEKNLTNDEGYEFGYAVGVFRPLASVVKSGKCRWCRESFLAGVELYGGLGSNEQFGFKNTAQYVGPGLAWRIGEDSTLKISPAFGLTQGSSRMLLRFGYTYEVNDFGRKVARLFRK